MLSALLNFQFIENSSKVIAIIIFHFLKYKWADHKKIDKRQESESNWMRKAEVSVTLEEWLSGKWPEIYGLFNHTLKTNLQLLFYVAFYWWYEIRTLFLRRALTHYLLIIYKTVITQYLLLIWYKTWDNGFVSSFQLSWNLTRYTWKKVIPLNLSIKSIAILSLKYPVVAHRSLNILDLIIS